MSVRHRVVAFLLAGVIAVAAAAALASCGGGGEKKIDLLATGEYQFSVSGTLDLEFQAESASAVPIGALQTHTADVSGDVTLKMGDDGSFSLEQWGISGKVEVNGDTVNITATDSPKEPSTGKTDKDGTKTDTYWQAETQNQTTYVGYNADTIGMSGSDPLGPGTTSFTQETGSGTNIPFMDDAGETYLNLRHARLTFNRTGGAQTPQATATPTPQPTTQPTTTPTPAAEAQKVRTEQQIKCQHTQPGVKSDLFDFVLAILVGAAPQSRENGQPPTLVLHIASPDGQVLTGPALAGQEVPLAGATVAASVQGPGVLDSQASGVTDANGQVTLRAGINKFGAYNITIDSVVGADGTVYGFDQNSVLSLTYEVGQVCELTPTPSP